MERLPSATEAIMQTKAFVLLYDFHALRFPTQSVHRHKFRVVDDAFFPDGSYEVPERILTKRSVAIIVKEQEIRQQFRDMLHAQISQLVRGNTYGPIMELCEKARQGFHAEQDLSDQAGQPLSSQEILPPRDVVEAMAEDFVWHRRYHCEPLERFIAQTQSAWE